MTQFHGVVAAAITPRLEDPEIDHAALFELLDFLAARPLQGVALLGTTGEFLHFDLVDRLRLIRLAARRSRLPIFLGVTHSTYSGTLRMAREGADSGCAGLLVMPPYFFRFAPDDIEAFYFRLASDLAGSIPVFLYNIPAFTNPLPAANTATLLRSGQFAGIKDSSGDLDYLQSALACRAGHACAVFVGNDVVLVEGRRLGADGVVSGVACAVPELILALNRAVTAGAGEAVTALRRHLDEFILWIDALPAPWGIRAALRCRGLRTGPEAIYPGPHNAALLQNGAAWFQEWLPDVLRECQNVESQLG